MNTSPEGVCGATKGIFNHNRQESSIRKNRGRCVCATLPVFVPADTHSQQQRNLFCLSAVDKNSGRFQGLADESLYTSFSLPENCYHTHQTILDGGNWMGKVLSPLYLPIHFINSMKPKQLSQDYSLKEKLKEQLKDDGEQEFEDE